MTDRTVRPASARTGAKTTTVVPRHRRARACNPQELRIPCAGIFAIVAAVYYKILRRGLLVKQVHTPTAGHIAVPDNLAVRWVPDLRGGRCVSAPVARPVDPHALIAVASHAARTPLTTATGYGELLADGDLGALNEDQRAGVAAIVNGIARLERLFGHVTDLIHIQAGTLALFVEELDYLACVADVATLARPLASEKWVQITVDTLTTELRPRWDGRRIAQVLASLLEIAIASAPAGGQVTVRTRVFGRRLMTEVANGAPEPSLHGLDDVLGGLDAGPVATRSPDGRALDLLVCKALVEAHGGSMGAEHLPGLGDNIWFQVPLGHAPGE